MGVGPFQAGHKLSAGEMNEIARAVAKIVRLSGDKFIQVTHTADGTTLRLSTEDLVAYLPKTRRGRWVRLTAWNESDNTYSWIRLQDDGEAEYVPQETGTLNAKEVNGIEGIPVGGAGVGTVVWLEKDTTVDPAEWRFEYEKGGVFPVILAYDGGSAGSETTQASWTYTVTDALSEVELGATVDPTAGVHKWVRPTVGVMIAATFGYAHRNAAGDFVIGWINEVADQEACA